MIQFVPIAIGMGAAVGCARCGTPQPVSYRPAAELGALIASAPPGDGVALVGPEPFAHPELPTLISACRQAGFLRVALETDGGALAAHGNAAGALRAGVRHLWVRVLGADDAAHDLLAGRPGLGATSAAGVAVYLAAAAEAGETVAVTAVVPVCRHTIPELPAIVAGCARRGFHAVRLINGADLPRDAGALIAAACDTGMVNRIWVSAEGDLPLPESHRLHGEIDGGPAGLHPEAGAAL